MKTIVFLIFIFFISIPLKSEANPFGLGFFIGTESGISTNYMLRKRRSLATNFGYSTSDEVKLHLRSDLIVHNPKAILIDERFLNAYWGAGVYVNLLEDYKDDDIEVGARLPLGIGYYFKKSKVDVFLELGLGMNVVPETEFRFFLALGGRYYFF